MKKNELVAEWLKRAASNLARARYGLVSDEVLYEDLCFDCQQAVEKSLKAVLIKNDISFPKTHSLNYLLDILRDNKIDVPENLNKAVFLNEYAIESRYPGNYEPVTEADYKESLEIAESIYKFVISVIK